MWLLVVAAAVVAWYLYMARSRMIISAAPPRLVGDGTFAVEVVGESSYLASFNKICGARTTEGVNMDASALLILEEGNRFDKQAVRVTIKGYTVGYLPRATARDFRRAALYVGLGRSTIFECAATIRGGRDEEPGNLGNYSVWLDLPTGYS